MALVYTSRLKAQVYYLFINRYSKYLFPFLPLFGIRQQFIITEDNKERETIPMLSWHATALRYTLYSGT